MPQRLLLEGTDLEALMLRAREEYGPEARVVRAEKVRTGGLLGFFAREKFELTLEISDAVAAAALAAGPAPGASAVTAASRTTTRDQVVDAQLAEEIADAKAAREAMLRDTVGPLRQSAAAQPSVGIDAVAAPDAPAQSQPAAPSRAVARSTRAVEPTDMAQFDELVLQLTEQAATVRAADPSRAVTPSRARSYAPASFPGIDRSAAVVLSSSVAPAPHGSIDSWGDVSGTNAGTHADPTPDLTFEQRDGVVVNRWGVFTDVATAVATKCTAPALLALGVPARFIQGFDGLGTPVPLLEVVARFGTPPVRRPESGEVVLIAGPADKALAVATQVAAWVGLSARSVMLAGEIEAIRGNGRRIRTEDQARVVRRRAEEAGRFGDPTIVALGVVPGRRGAAAAASLFAAIEADTTWAVVDATKRVSSYAGELKILAEHRNVDAIAAVGIADAQAPGAVLDAPIPTAWMDGLPASGIVWAALLGERIAARD